MVFQSSSKQVSRRFQGGFKEVSSFFHGYFKGVQGLLQRYFTEIARFFFVLYKGCSDFDIFFQKSLQKALEEENSRMFQKIFKGDKKEFDVLLSKF